MCFFWQIFEVWCLHQSLNLTSVETFWRHEFMICGWCSRCHLDMKKLREVAAPNDTSQN
jgi:hypothetical protein